MKKMSMWLAPCLGTTAALALCATGCGRDSTGGGNNPDANHAQIDGAPGSADASQVAATTVMALRMNPPASGTAVSLQNVTVVGRVTSSKSGKLWIQDHGGGQYSGIELFCNYGGSSPNCSMTRTQIDAFVPGQIVNVVGTFDPFTPSMPAGAPTTLEISSITVTDTGSTETPVAVDVDAASVSIGSVDAAAYKGAYVHITGANPLTVSSVTAAKFQASCTSMTGVAGTTYHGFEATGGGQTLGIGLGFYATMTYCLPDCGYPCTNEVTAAETFTDLKGVVEADANKTTSDKYLVISPVLDTDLTK